MGARNEGRTYAAFRIVARVFLIGFGVSQASALPAHDPALQEQETAPSSTAHWVVITERDLSRALVRLAHIFDVDIIVPQELVSGRRAEPFAAHVTLEEALTRLLAGSGLAYRYTGARIIAITRAETPLDKRRRTATLEKHGARQRPESLRRRRVPSEPRSAFFPLEEREAAETSVMEEIIVTGSRIPRRQVTVSLPLTRFSYQDAQASGITDVGEMLLELPSVETAISLQSSQLSTQNSGISSIDILGLGSNRTLVLLDGRRIVSNSSTGNRIDFGTIPFNLIDRIEVIRGGASAAYGSDAIAGVVNIITRQHFEGLELGARGGTTTAGGGEEITLSLLAGGQAESGRHDLLLSLIWESRGRIGADQRDWAVRSVEFDATGNRFITPDPSSAIPGGMFNGGAFFFDESGLRQGFDRQRDGYEFRPFFTLSIPRDRLLAALRTRSWIGESTSLAFGIDFAREHNFSRRAPDAATSSLLGPVPLDNPFVPEAVREDALARGLDGIPFRRRLVELGRREREVRRRTVRAAFDLEGEVVHGWRWEAYFRHGWYDQNQSRRNDVVLPRFRQALDVERDPERPGSFRCRDPLARAAGCVPLNLFGVGSITPDAANFIRLEDRLTVDNRQLLAGLAANGPLVRLPAAPLQTAIGFEYRRERSRVLPDTLTQAGLTSLTQLPEIRGAFRVIEGFAEFLLPISETDGLAGAINIEGGLRVGHYSQGNVGTIFSFRAAANWRPRETLAFRAQFSRSQRAPDIAEIFSPPRGDFDRVDDPCDGVRLGDTGTIAQNCLAVPAIRATVEREGVFRQRRRSVPGPNSGNPSLREEVADTVSAGWTLYPLGSMPFSISGDLYRIVVKDAISALSSQAILDGCFGTPRPSPAERLCTFITRDADGQIAEILNIEENLDRLSLTAFDLSLAGSHPLGNGSLWPRELSWRIDYTHLFSFTQRSANPLGDESVSRLDGEVGHAKDRFVTKLSFAWPRVWWRWRVRYVGRVLDSHERAAAFARRGIVDPLVLQVGDQWLIDTHLRVLASREGPIEFFMGVNNLFDNEPPFLPDGSASGNANNFSPEYEVAGRFVYAGLLWRF